MSKSNLSEINYFSIDFINDKLIFLDQTKLPLSETYVETENYDRVAEAIERRF